MRLRLRRRTERCLQRAHPEPRSAGRRGAGAYPVREEQGLVWVWPGEPGRAALHRLPDLPWLTKHGWTSVGGEQMVNAGFLLLHESFADVTKIPVLDPSVSPSVLKALPPPLEVEVTETTVSLSRRYPPGRLPDWQARALGVAADERTRAPPGGALPVSRRWVDHWDVVLDGSPAQARMRFTQLVTPVDDRVSRLLWRVSRDFGVGDSATDGHVWPRLFVPYYATLAAALETMQQVIDADGPQPRSTSARTWRRCGSARSCRRCWLKSAVIRVWRRAAPGPGDQREPSRRPRRWPSHPPGSPRR